MACNAFILYILSMAASVFAGHIPDHVPEHSFDDHEVSFDHSISLDHGSHHSFDHHDHSSNLFSQEHVPEHSFSHNENVPEHSFSQFEQEPHHSLSHHEPARSYQNFNLYVGPHHVVKIPVTQHHDHGHASHPLVHF